MRTRWLLVIATVFFVGVSSVISTNGATTWRFKKTYGLDNNWKNSHIVSENVDIAGGNVEINVTGQPYDLCPKGVERMRFTWRFDKDISELRPGERFGVKIETHLINATSDCDGRLAYRTGMAAQASAGSTLPWDTWNGPPLLYDGNRFQTKSSERASPHADGPNAGSAVIEVWDAEPSADGRGGFFVVNIWGPGGTRHYLYFYEPIKGTGSTSTGGGNTPTGGNTGTGGNTSYSLPQLGGTWYREGNTGLPASILQSGSSLVFTNERGESSYGRFEGSDGVVAIDWQGGLRGKLNGDRTRIDWANGTSWSRGAAEPTASSFVSIGGTWYREGNRTLPAEILQTDGGLVFINERGERSAGSFKSKYVVVADQWERGLRGIVDQGLRKISWANGTTWQR